ncbi:MAG: hypothetical protein J6D31_10305 [Clostridia bacterium]|nr:hypothetical protein [Clostridia bacterium]
MPVLLIGLSLLFLLLTEWPLARRAGNPMADTLRTARFWCRFALSLAFSAAALLIATQEFSSLWQVSWLTLSVALASTLVFALLSLCLRLLAGGRWLLRLACALVFALLLSVFCEVIVFNHRAIATTGLQPIEIGQHMGVSNVTSEKREDGFYEIYPGRRLVLNLPDTALEMKTLFVELEAYLDEVPVDLFTVTVSVTDAGNSAFLVCPARTIAAASPLSRYMTMQLHGITDQLRITVEADMDLVALRHVTVNAPIPFSFSLGRTAAVFAILLLALALRPGSKLYLPRLAPFGGRKIACTALALLLLFALCLSFSAGTPWLSTNMATHQAQYAELAEAFLSGRLDLYMHEPPAFLAEMDNPYDTSARKVLETKTGETAYWDAAYYEGRYYVYFGVLPVLLLYLPARVLTGTPLLNGVAVLLLLPLLLLAVFALVYELICRFGRAEETPLLTYLLLSCMLAVGSGVLTFALYPDMYSVPILTGLVCTAAGLALWLRAGRDPACIRPLPLALGSLCMALVAACRPQLLLLSLLSLPLFFDAVVRKRTLFSRRGLWHTLAACLPYVAVALPIMWYNAARFGSPFDFGANYNLTTNDMTLRGYEVGRIGLSFFTYLLQPPVITGKFPFLQPVKLETAYMGVTIAEGTYGGLFAAYPFSWLSLLPLLFRDLRKKPGATTGLLLLAGGILLALFDAQGAGILQRYYADFLLPILASAIIGYLLATRDAPPAHRRYWHHALLFSALCLGIYEVLLLFTYLGPALGAAITFWG